MDRGFMDRGFMDGELRDGELRDRELRDRLLGIAVAGLILAGAIFICLCLFSEMQDNEMLPAALSCSVLAGLFHIIREFGKK